MKAGLVGPSYEMRSLPFDAQRTINLYPVLDETGEGKEVSALYGTPGLSPFSDATGGKVRATLSCGNGRAFFVYDDKFVELYSDGTTEERGEITTLNGPLSIAENGLQIFVAEGTNGYVYTFENNSFQQVTDEDFPGAQYVTFKDGFFIIVPPNNQGKFYISAIYNGLQWDALDFATAESSPDGLKACYAFGGQLWLFGETTTEVWFNSGDADFPYARLSGGIMETGCASAFTIAKADNSIFWVGKDSYGQGIVYRANGFAPQRISTQAIEYAVVKNGKDLSGLQAYCYQQEGHLFYVLTGGSLETTLTFDAATRLWHERAYLNEFGVLEPHLGVCGFFAFNKNLVGDRESATIYELDLDVNDDNGREIKRTRTFTHLYAEGKEFSIKSLQVDFEYGVGSEAGSDPVAVLEMSTDGGRTWSNEYQCSIGKIGQYKTRCLWRRLGIYRQCTFRVSITDKVKVIICGAYFNA